MRKVTFGGANSLDNYFARADESVDWLMWCDESQAFMSEYWKTIDTIVMGRKTYEFALRNSKGADNFSGIKSFVCSRTLPEGPDAHGIVIASDAAVLVRDLKSRPGKDICLMGGGNLARSLFEADLIAEIGFNIHPVLLGSGIPVFYGMRQVNLELMNCQTFKNGCVLVRYRVKHESRSG